MKAPNILRLSLIGTVALVLVEASYADTPADRPHDADKRTVDKYVMVTGSMIPQKVTVQSIGTKTVSPMRVYTRREIDMTGRVNTTEVLSYDPSVRVFGHP